MGIKSIRPATIHKVVEYLAEELGLTVYGRCRDLDNLTEGYGCGDYDADDIIKYRKLLMNDATFTEEKI